MAGEIGLIRMEQGATELSVPSSCVVTVEDGGQINLESGGFINADSGSYVSFDVGSSLRLPSESFSTAATLANCGVSILVNGSSAPATWTLTAPVAGVLKFIRFSTDFGSSAVGYVNAGAGCSFESSVSSTNAYCRVIESDHGLSLIGLNTTSWAVTYKTTGVTFTTGTT